MISNSGGSNPAKKRKGNEGNAIVSGRSGGGFLSTWFGYFSGRDAAPSTQSNDVNNCNTSSQLDRMEKIIMRIEEKQNMLEAKCSSIENALDVKLQSVQDQVDKLEDNVNSLRSDVNSIHVDAQQNNEYNQMILTNLGWTYSADVLTYDDWVSQGYSDYQAYYLEDAATELKKITIAMRRGKFSESHTSTSNKIISVWTDNESENTHSNNELRPHWDEFAAALRQFTPAIKMVPNDLDSYFSLGNVAMNQITIAIIREALIEKPFTYMCFHHNAEVDIEVGGMNIDSIIRIAESNTSLRKLEIHNNRIGSDHVERLCSIVLNHPLMELNLDYSIDDDGVGNAILTSLLSSQELNLEKLSMRGTSIKSEISILLADFVMTNRILKHLDLGQNNLNDDDATLIANALRGNTTLRLLDIEDNNVTIECEDAFKYVLCDVRSLNAVATSNHSCYVSSHHGYIDRINSSEKIEDNRGKKIYSLLSDRHVKGNLSNTQYFSDIDAKLLPNMLEAVQKYGKTAATKTSSRIMPITSEKRIKSVSIVYEVMRKWEKVFNLYESA